MIWPKSPGAKVIRGVTRFINLAHGDFIVALATGARAVVLATGLTPLIGGVLLMPGGRKPRLSALVRSASANNEHSLTPSSGFPANQLPRFHHRITACSSPISSLQSQSSQCFVPRRISLGARPWRMRKAWAKRPKCVKPQRRAASVTVQPSIARSSRARSRRRLRQ
jgi:hypothetical protein